MNPTPANTDSLATPDPWAHLRRYTAARIALGRSGGSVPTRELLAFGHDHALARDAVLTPFAIEQLSEKIRQLGSEVIELTSSAPDRASYLRRPDLGRRLSDDSRALLSARNAPASDLVIIVADGLSSLAAERQAAPVLAALLPRLIAAGWTLAPICVVHQSRVGLMDEVGVLLHARLALILLGERPGLGAPDSLGAYFVHAPGPGRTNADRNCLSNIRAEGLPPAAAAERLAALLALARRTGSSGIALKDESAAIDAGLEKQIRREP